MQRTEHSRLKLITRGHLVWNYERARVFATHDGVAACLDWFRHGSAGMKTVWILNQYAPAENGHTHRHRHTYLSRYLSDHGWRVILIAAPGTRRSHEASLDVPKGQRFLDTASGNSIHRTLRGTRGSSIGGRLAGMRLYERRAIHDTLDLPVPDVVVGSSVSLFAGRAARTLARRYGTPFVFEFRDIWPQTIANMGTTSSKNPIYRYLRRLERSLYRDAETIVTTLPNGAEHVAESGGDTSKVLWIPNMVDMSGPGARTPLSDKPGILTLLYLGSITPVYALENLIEAAALLQERQIHNVRIKIVGNGRSRRSLIDLASQLGTGNVQFIDPVPGEMVPALLAEAHAGIASFQKLEVVRRFGSSNNKVSEYMAAGIPVIFALDSWNNPIAEANAGFTVDPEDPVSLANAISKFASMPLTELQAMGDRGHAYASENYSVDAVAPQFDAMLRDALRASS